MFLVFPGPLLYIVYSILAQRLTFESQFISKLNVGSNGSRLHDARLHFFTFYYNRLSLQYGVTVYCNIVYRPTTNGNE